MKVTRALAWLVLVLYLLNVGFCATANFLELTLFAAITKIVIVPLLVLYLFLRTSADWVLKHIVFAVGLGFAWIADIVLLSDAAAAFYTGLGLFFVMHILYIVSFQRHTRKHRALVYAIAGIIYALAAALTIYFLSKVETALVVTVVALYVAVVGVMATVATNLNFLGAFGGAFFAISDLLIALEKFGTWSWIPDENVLSGLVIAFYGVAQLLLACALVRQTRKQPLPSLTSEFDYAVPMISQHQD